MAITSPVTMGKIHAEFGGNASFSAYVRGGAYVPNGPTENNNIATVASSLKMSQFLGAKNIDLVANGFTWNNSYTATNTIILPTQTIGGIEPGYSITLNFVLTGNAALTITKNGNPVSNPVTVTNGDTLYATIISFSGSDSGDLTVTNTTANVPQAYLTYLMTGGGGGGGGF